MSTIGAQVAIAIGVKNGTIEPVVLCWALTTAAAGTPAGNTKSSCDRSHAGDLAGAGRRDRDVEAGRA